MKLSPKELIVLRLVAEGMSDKEIGTKLGISERTVQTYLTRIMLKLQAKNRVNAAVLFFMNNPDLYKTYSNSKEGYEKNYYPLDSRRILSECVRN